MLPVFVYGTLRPGSWNHERWLAPWLAAPCTPARLPGHHLHSHRRLPYLVPGAAGDTPVTGDLATLDVDRGGAALAHLDVLEGVDAGHYVRVEVVVDADGGARRAWTYVAGPAVARHLGPRTRVVHGDWLRVA